MVPSGAELSSGAEQPSGVAAAAGAASGPAESAGSAASGSGPDRGPGLDVAPFVATRYADPERLAAYTAPAYDLIEPAERARLISADPRSIVHLTLPTFGAEDAAARLAAWRADGTLAVDHHPALYLYDLDEPGPHRSTRGWLGAVALAPPSVVAPHEATVAAVVADRRELRAATGADLEPVVFAHDGEPGPAAALASRFAAERTPVADLTDDAGVRHRLWRVADPVEVDVVRADLARRRAVIADGHHRWAAAAGWRDHHGASPDAPAGRVLALVVPAGEHGPQVRAIHRVLPHTALDGLDVHRFRWAAMGPPAAAEAEELLATASAPLVLATDGERWLRLTDPDSAGVTPAAWRRLDVALVDVLLVGERSAVLLRHSVAAAVAEARRAGGVALLVPATPTDTVLELAARGVLMPRKSTFFVPKPRTGLVLRCFVDQPPEPESHGSVAPPTKP